MDLCIIRYFQCQPKYGLFAPVHKVTRIGFPSTTPAKAKTTVRKTAATPSGLKRSPSASSISSMSSVASSASCKPSRTGLVSYIHPHMHACLWLHNLSMLTRAKMCHFWDICSTKMQLQNHFPDCVFPSAIFWQTLVFGKLKRLIEPVDKPGLKQIGQCFDSRVTWINLLICFSVQHYRETSLQMAFLGKCLLSTQIRLVIKCTGNKIYVFTLYPCMLASNWLFSMNPFLIFWKAY